MKDHAYCAQEPTERESPSAKRKRDAARQIRDKRRQKSRINIGVAITRWKALLKDKCFQRDAEVACFLLDCGRGCEHVPADALLQRQERSQEQSQPDHRQRQPQSSAQLRRRRHRRQGHLLQMLEVQEVSLL